MSASIDLTGQVFGRLTVTGRHGSKRAPCGSISSTWACRCACGTEKVVQGQNLRNGHSTSCGCAMLERVTKHGAARGYARTSEYGIWQAMRGRCRVAKSGGYKHYGGRGISVCARWDDFENFLADMGRRPSSKHSIDRIENNGDYEPGNCRWATNTEQQLNKSTTKNSTDGVSGVSYDAKTGNWDATIKIHGTALFLGGFTTRAEAAIARVAAERVRNAMLEYARHTIREAA